MPTNVGRCPSVRLIATGTGERKDRMDINKETFDQIAELINSDDSPVGIDALKTHVIIIHKLSQIEERLTALEKRQE